MTRIVLILAAMVFSAGAQAGANCENDSIYKTVSKKELKQIVAKKNALIIDVNGEGSYNENHIPGAIHYEAHESDFAKVLPKNKNAMIVAYCGGPLCSAWIKAAQKACEFGYTNIRHFKDGISGWLD